MMSGPEEASDSVCMEAVVSQRVPMCAQILAVLMNVTLRH